MAEAYDVCGIMINIVIFIYSVEVDVNSDPESVYSSEESDLEESEWDLKRDPNYCPISDSESDEDEIGDEGDDELMTDIRRVDKDR